MATVFLFFSLCCVVYAQLRERCPTTTEQLLREGCARGCIIVARDVPCPVCREGCADVTDECMPMATEDVRACSEAQICLAAGVSGRYICVDRLAEGQNCSAGLNFVDQFIQRSRLLDGVDARDRVTQISNTEVPCESGLVCRRESLDRRVCMAETGPCPPARQRDTQVECDEEDGSFAPRQCRRRDGSRTYRCHCVMPSTGDAVPGTQVDVSEPDNGPDCEDMVRDRCQYRSSLGVMYDVRSGQTFIDPRNCSHCLCRDGVATLCKSIGEGSCARLNPTPIRNRNCTIRGRTLPNGESVPVDCNRCGCKNGVLRCTRRECEDSERDADSEDVEDPVEERNCRSCGMMRPEPVCGMDGRTYPSRCFAVTCRGLNPDNLTAGSCSRRDVCGENPCEDGEVCMKNGGVTCLSREGCRPQRLRRCVDLDTLRCSSREGDSNSEDPTRADQDESSNDDDDTVCGSNGRTFSSVCNLIQNSVETEVAYAGSCNRTECTGGQVCGTDGETYENICMLRSNSANARVDYRGECKNDETGGVVNDRCTRLRRSGRCANLAAECSSRIKPGDGCCPVCGGAITIGLDQDAVDEYVRLNPSVDTVDELLKTLVVSRFIPEDIVRRCKVSANLLRTGDLHIVLENVMHSDGACSMAAKEMADRINNPPMDDGTATTTTAANPQILQLATVAQTSPLVEETGGLTGGAVSVVSFSLPVILVPICTLLF